jgi:hypothetical protein
MGSGNGNVTFSVAVNTGGARDATLTIAGQVVTITQTALSCSYAVSPTSASSGASGGAGTQITVTTTAGCSWTAASNVNWLSIVTGAAGTGTAKVTYSVLANTGPARAGTLTVAGQTVTISQSTGCVYAINPTSLSIGTAGGNGGPVTVTAQTDCQWTTTSNVNWITVTSGASGTGNGSVSFTVAANTGGARMGTLTIAGSTFTVSQDKK